MSSGSWQKVRFDQICKNISDRIDDPKQAKTDYYVGLQHLDSEDPKISRHGSPQDVSKTKLLFKSGHILFGKRNWYLRRLAVAERDGICSAHMLVLESIKGKTIKDFVPLLMFGDDFYEKALMVSAGSMSPTIKWKDLAPLEFHIPPIPEQENILFIMRKIDDTILELQNMHKKINILYLSKREFLLNNGIGHTKFKKVKWYYGKTIEIPQEWSVYPLEKICDILDHKRVPISATKRKEMKGSIPYYGANGIVDYVNDFIFDEKIILLAEDGGNFYDYLQKPIAQFVNQKCWVNNHAHVLKANSEFIIPEYLYHSLNHKNIIPFIQGGTRSKLNQDGGLKDIPIILPENKSEQNKIIDILESIKNLDFQIINHLINLKLLKKSILHSKLTKEKIIVTN